MLCFSALLGRWCSFTQAILSRIICRCADSPFPDAPPLLIVTNTFGIYLVLMLFSQIIFTNMS